MCCPRASAPGPETSLASGIGHVPSPPGSRSSYGLAPGRMRLMSARPYPGAIFSDADVLRVSDGSSRVSWPEDGSASG